MCHSVSVEVRGQIARVPNMCVPRIKLRCLGLAAGAFTQGAISPALEYTFSAADFIASAGAVPTWS